MNKLLQLFDRYFLKFGVIFTLIFVGLYPKLPSIQITHTWVYIRLEDFAISFVVGVWLLQLLRRKVRLGLPTGVPIILYWIIGLASLLFSIVFIGPSLANFFPKIAVFQYVRRIEYMILFFVAFSTIKSLRDVKDYLIGLCIGLSGIVLYGLGQHFYLTLWHTFPAFFEKNPFCFPSFQTGNEEFAKGIPLCLPENARITSTFGGHYDLAAFMVLIIPLLFGLFLAIKQKISKIFVGILSFLSLILLIFTSSRVSFVAYLIGIIASLFFLRKKKWIIPVLLASIILLLSFSGSTVQRFLDTIRVTSIVTNSQGQVVGVAKNSLPEDLQKKISKNPVDVDVPYENLPSGSSFITLPQAPVATSVAVVKKGLSAKELARLKLANGGLELATVSGSFLVQKALVYDISFTTRFQAEWPNAWKAFMRNPLLGSGYSSITLASDNDYLRLLGETGLLGFVSFFLIFIVFGIYVKRVASKIRDPFVLAVVYGLSGGVIGLACNGIMIDVFEASKVAEPLWILLGVGIGLLALYEKEKVRFLSDLKKIALSPFFICIGLITVGIAFFMNGLATFFVGDDFTWLRWAAQSTTKDIAQYFINANGFFYRPIDKTIILALYTFFSFEPQGYHVFGLFVHILATCGVFFLTRKLLKSKLWGAISALFFLIAPSHAENIFWFATISVNISAMLMIWALFLFTKSREKGLSIVYYCSSLLLHALALFSYEASVVFPLLVLITDVFITGKLSPKKQLLRIVPFAILDVLYLIARSLANVAPVGGDYSYNLNHLIPNAIGNFVGYLGLFLTGEWILPWYTLLRAESRAYALPIVILLIILIGVLLFIWKTYKWKGLYSSYVKTKLYGFIFSIIALLPFLGFGNLAGRYGYLATIGFILLLLPFVQYVARFIYKKSPYFAPVVGIGAVIVYMAWCYSTVQLENKEWSDAGKITYNALGYFKVEQDTLPSTANIYIVDLPIRKANAWIFPVGFGDGMWFVYRYDDQRIAYISLKEARARVALSPSNSYIFQFDQQGTISRVR